MQQIVAKHVEGRISDMFLPALKYTDTPWDKQVLKGIVAELTNISLTTRLQGTVSRKST